MRKLRLTAALVACAFLVSGCFGSFNLTRKVYNWNDTISQDKWVKELAFLVMYIVPVYGIAELLDGVVLNSIEFWTGENPVMMGEAESKTVTSQVGKDTYQAVIEASNGEEGKALNVSYLKNGEPVGSMRIAQEGDAAVATDQNGRELFTAKLLPDGGVLLLDADKDVVALHYGTQADAIVAGILNQTVKASEAVAADTTASPVAPLAALSTN